MNIQFEITSTTLNQIYNFAKLYERLYLIPEHSVWFEKLSEIARRKSTLAAVTFQKSDLLDTKILFDDALLKERLTEEGFKDFQNYLNTLDDVPNIFNRKFQYSIEMFEKIHRGVMGTSNSKAKYKFRKSIRILPKFVIENKVYKTINRQVNMKPESIVDSISDFIKWLEHDSKSLNSLFVAAISHLKLAEIHPYDDGNGRLARVFENGIFYSHDYTFYPLISLEEYYLTRLETYYQIIEDSISSGDMTKWLEFYTEGLLSAINVTFDIIHEISGGTIDLHNRRVANLTEKEIEVIDILIQNTQASGAEIAKILGVTRQNINVILKRLEHKKAVEKIGKGTSSRYKLS